MSINVKQLLVTGGAGFIGSNFVYYMLKRYPDLNIVVLDKLTYAGNLDNFTALPEKHRSRFKFYRGDIGNIGTVRKICTQYKFDCVVNFAAESHVDKSIKDPRLFLKTNVLGTQVLLDICKEMWGGPSAWQPNVKFIQISTDEVLGTLGPTGYFTEESPLKPNNPYSVSKAASDLLVLAYNNTYGFPGICTRCSNNFGPYQFPEKLIPVIIRNALQHKPIPIYGDGLQVRDWLYVEDHCRAIELVLQGGNIGEVYNIGGSNEKTNLFLVNKIIEILNKQTGDAEINEGLIQQVKDRPGHDRRYAINASKLRKEFGWMPLLDFDCRLRQTVQWYLNNREWLRKIESGECVLLFNKSIKN